ncbi:MAG: hypothetical protein IJA07_11060 [Agathobacter sp.]|nr:hypothetical protein [Agathobacter sp.]
MDYSFVRKLVKDISVEDAKKIYSLLSEKGIEIFVKVGDIYENMIMEHISEEIFVNNSDLYVSAADLVFARTLVEELGLGRCLCSETESNTNIEKSEVEKAEEEFYRKHKQNQIFAWVIIAGVVVLMVLQFFTR